MKAQRLLMITGIAFLAIGVVLKYSANSLWYYPMGAGALVMVAHYIRGLGKGN